MRGGGACLSYLCYVSLMEDTHDQHLLPLPELILSYCVIYNHGRPVFNVLWLDSVSCLRSHFILMCSGRNVRINKHVHTLARMHFRVYAANLSQLMPIYGKHAHENEALCVG